MHQRYFNPRSFGLWPQDDSLRPGHYAPLTRMGNSWIALFP